MTIFFRPVCSTHWTIRSSSQLLIHVRSMGSWSEKTAWTSELRVGDHRRWATTAAVRGRDVRVLVSDRVRLHYVRGAATFASAIFA
jgi:hypothetical protein